MSKKKELTPLAIAISIALTAPLGAASAASTDSSPFAVTSLPTGYMPAHQDEGRDGDQGEHSHPEGSCGGDQGEHSHPDGGHGGDHGGHGH